MVTVSKTVEQLALRVRLPLLPLRFKENGIENKVDKKCVLLTERFRCQSSKLVRRVRFSQGTLKIESEFYDSLLLRKFHRWNCEKIRVGSSVAERLAVNQFVAGSSPARPSLTINLKSIENEILIGDWLTVGRLPLKQVVKVRILLPELLAWRISTLNSACSQNVHANNELQEVFRVSCCW